MKRIIVCLVCAGLLLCSGAAMAADKIGFINMKEVLLKSNAGKAAAVDLKKAFDRKKAIIQKKEENLKKFSQDMEKQKLVLKKEALKEKELEYQNRVRDYKRLVEDSNQEMARMDKELSAKLVPSVLKVARSIGKKDGYTLILDVSSAGLVYHAEGRDITSDVVAKYNKDFASGK